MKKLLMVALALIGMAAPNRASAYDQVSVAPVSSLTDGSYYYIYDSHGDNGTTTEQESGNGVRYAFRKAMSDDAGANVRGTHIKPYNAWTGKTLDNYSVWKAIATESGAWKFQNVGNEYYITGNSGNVSVNEESTATAFVLEAVSGQTGTFTVKVEGSNNTRWDGNADTQMVYWGGSGHPIRFYEAVADGDGYNLAGQGFWNVTYTYPEYKGKVVSKIVLLPEGEGAHYHVPAIDFMNVTAILTGDPEVREDNRTFNVKGDWVFPAIVSNHVYRAKMRPSTAAKKSLWYNGTHAVSGYTDAEMLEDNADMNLFWYFKIGDMTDEGKLPLTIHGVGMTDEEGIEVANTNNALGEKSTTPTVWYLTQSSATSADNLDIVLRHSGVTESYMNDVNGTLGGWAASAGKTDAGSVMRLTELAESDWTKMSADSEATEDEINAAKANPTPAAIRAIFAKMEVDASLVAPYIAAGDHICGLGLGNDADRANWQAAKDALGTKIRPAAFNNFKDAFAVLLGNASRHIPEEGLYVNLRHPQYANVYMGLVNNMPKRVSGDDKKVITLKPAADGSGFVMYCDYVDGYIKHPAVDQTNASIVSNVAEASVYTIDLEDLSDYHFGFKANGVADTRAYLHTNSSNLECADVVRWAQGTQSSWYIETSDAETAANEYLAGSKAYFAGLTFGTGIGQYQITAAGQAAADAANAVGSDASIADKRAAGLALRNVESTLNMPQPGHIYLFSKADGSMYMSNDTVSDHRATMLAPTTENLISRLFYLDESNHLLSLKSGKVMGRFNSSDAHGANDVDHSWRTVLLSQTDKVGTFTFGEAAERGKYTIAAQGSRYLYNANADVDAGGSAANNGYYWTIEDKGEWIPVAGTDVDHATLCLPFAVSVREGMTVYTAKVNNGKIVPVEFTGDVIPANTPVMVDFDGVQRDAENNLVYLDRYYGETTPVEGNDLLGSVYAFNVDSPVALRTGANVFTPASGLVLGCRAYVSGGVHTHSTDAIEAEIDALVGKVFTIKNADVANNRGYLIYNPDTEAIWTSGKGGRYTNAAADEAAPTNVNFHWTLVKHDGKRYLYNLAAKKYAAAYTDKGGNGGKAEFVWHFSDYPTAIDFHFYDYAIANDLASATVNIIGGENKSTLNNLNRPGGMMIINGNGTHPVPAVAGNSANDGCGFTISIVEGATAGEVATVSDAHAAMEAEHAVAADYIANYDDAVNETPGHYNSDGYAAFSAAMSAATHDAESKYYALTRARIAAGNNINTFVDGDAYRLTNAEGDQLVARIAWNEARYTLSTGIADVNDEDVDLNWLCTIDENGYVSFTHGFEIDERAHEANGPAAVRARVAEGNKVVYHTLAAPAVATYDGLGNIGLGDLAVKSSSSLGSGAETTGISELTAEADAATGIVYDLQGRRVNGAAKGLLIVNGKKTYRK